MKLKRLIQRSVHFGERIIRESKKFPSIVKGYGFKIAVHSYIDGIIPPGKSEHYIRAITEYVDDELSELVDKYNKNVNENTELENQNINFEKVPIWCCWWQGEEQMPEVVKLCHTRLKQVIPGDKAQLHLITLENYKQYVEIPSHIIEKFESGIITMTTMSDVLRFQLLYKYGGYWLDATLFFTDNIPEEYFTKTFFCQRMVCDQNKVKREACKGNWCGFSMAGKKGNLVFQYMNEAFSFWWEKHNSIIDYVLIDYLLWTAYRKIPNIKRIIDSVPDNNEDIFEMYQVLNTPYSVELYNKITKRNVMHKLTYKMDLIKETLDGQITLYGYLFQCVYGKEL